MRPLTFSILLACSLGFKSHGCIQRFGTAADGSRAREHIDVSYQVHKALRESMAADLPKEGARWEALFRGKTSFPARNDYAVALIYLGRPLDAIPLLEALEKEKPGQYETAANLGTAFELADKNKEALHW